MNVSFSQNGAWASEGTIDLVEGAIVIISCTYRTAIGSNPSVVVKKRGQTVSITSGSASGNGTTVGVLPTITFTTTPASYGTYVVIVTTTVSGETWVNKIQLRVQRLKAEK